MSDLQTREQMLGALSIDIVVRLRRHDLDLAPEWKDKHDQSSWCDTADALLAEAADQITRLRQLLSEAENREMEARAAALEEAANVADVSGFLSVAAEIRAIALQSEESGW